MTNYNRKSVIKRLLLFVAAFSPFSLVSAQEQGEKIFIENCAVCHTIGGGPLVGPDLKSVNSKYDEEWLIDFIQSSQTLVSNGDEKATKVFNDFFMIPMPDQPFDVSQVKSVLTYIDMKSTAEPQEMALTDAIDADSQSPSIGKTFQSSSDNQEIGLLSYVLIGVMGIETITMIIMISTIIILTKNIKSLPVKN